MTNTIFTVCQTLSSRNRLSSVNILACSSRSAQPLSRPPPNLCLRRFRFGPSGLDAASFGANRISVLDAFNKDEAVFFAKAK